MGIKNVLFFIFVSYGVVTGQTDYRDNFAKAFKANDMLQARTIALEWIKNGPDVPGGYIALSRVLWSRAKYETINLVDTNKHANNSFQMLDSAGKVVGDLQFGTGFHKDTLKLALQVLSVAKAKFPYRIDVHFALADLLNKSDQFDALYDVLADAVKMAKIGKDSVRWHGNEVIPIPINEFMANTLYEYGREYNNKATEEDDKRYLKIAILLTENYPESNFAYRSIAFYYYNKKDFVKALEYFEKAHQAHPNDGVALYNLVEGNIYLNNIEYAKVYLTKMMSLENDEKARVYAKKRLEGLK